MAVKTAGGRLADCAQKRKPPDLPWEFAHKIQDKNMKDNKNQSPHAQGLDKFAGMLYCYG